MVSMFCKSSLFWHFLHIVSIIFFVREIFKFKYDKVFVRYSASISKFDDLKSRENTE